MTELPIIIIFTIFLVILIWFTVFNSSRQNSSQAYDVISYQWSGSSKKIENPGENTITWYIVRVYTFYYENNVLRNYIAEHDFTIRNVGGTNYLTGIITTGFDHDPSISINPDVLSEISITPSLIKINSTGGVKWSAVVERFSVTI